MIWTVRINIPDGTYSDDIYSYPIAVVWPRGNFTINEIRYYAETLSASAFSWITPEVHASNTAYYWATPLYRAQASDTGWSTWPESYNEEYVVADGVIKDVPEYTNEPYSDNYVINSGKWGAVLWQVDKATGAITTKAPASPQNYLSSPEALAALPAADPGKIAYAKASWPGPWTANTDPSINGSSRISLRTDGDAVYPALLNWEYLQEGVVVTDPGDPDTAFGGDLDVIVITFLAGNTVVDVTGAYIELDLQNDIPDLGWIAEGQARASVIVDGPTGIAFFAASAAGEGRATASLTGTGAAGGTASGSGRATVSVRDQGTGEARLDGVAAEVLYTEPPGEGRVTQHHVQLAGQELTEEARATLLHLQQGGAQNPENAAAHTTLLHVQQGGAQDAEESGARVTWLSVQLMRVRTAPTPQPPPAPTPGLCTMYNVIRVGEEESGVRAVRGTYRRLSGDIFLYRRELLQRLRMSYFDAEDVTLTLTIPQGLP